MQGLFRGFKVLQVLKGSLVRLEPLAPKVRKATKVQQELLVPLARKV
jgi:hypothetical protein